MTTMVEVAPPGLIKLEPLSDPFKPFASLGSFGTPLLSPGDPFVLPRLSEHEPGSDRLIDTLRHSLHTPDTGTRVEAKTKSVKGKEKEEQAPIDHPTLQHSWTSWTVWADAVETDAAEIFQSLKDWDEFDNRAGPSRSPFLSEGGPAIFESLISTNPREHEGLSLPKLADNSPRHLHPEDPKDLLALALRSTFGLTTSDKLRWDEKSASFALGEGIRGVATSIAASASATGHFLEIGTAVRRLEILIDDQRTRDLTPTHHAFLHAVTTYLTYLKSRLSSSLRTSSDHGGNGDDAPDWIKRASDLRDIGRLATLLCEIMLWPLKTSKASPLPSRPAYLLTHIHSHLLAHISTEPSSASVNSPETLALAFILQQSSGPFFKTLHQWLGLSTSVMADDTIDPTSQPWEAIGITRKQRPSVKDRGGRWDYEFNSRHMPGFIPKEDRTTLFEAGKSLRLLRDASDGQHPLCSGVWGIEARWDWNGNSVTALAAVMDTHRKSVTREIERWRSSRRSRTGGPSRQSSVNRLRTPRKERKRIPAEFYGPPSVPATPVRPGERDPDEPVDHNSPVSLDIFRQACIEPPGSHLQSSNNRGTIWGPTSLEKLESFLGQMSSTALLPPESPNLPLFITSTVLAPLLAHCNLLTTSLVSFYLNDLDLLDHLDVLRAFFLAGDVGFTERASAALFGKDAAGAGEALGLGRRARTRARMGLTPARKGSRGAQQAARSADGDDDGPGEWGIGLGLGLSERHQWPPGGAELAYALRTTLFDDTLPGPESESKVWEGIENRVSFAIRDLPEDQDGQRAKWMNPQAIEALDFLHLSYSPDRSIRHVLPSALMSKYQRIHNFLLRLARVESVLRSTYIDSTHFAPSRMDAVKYGVDMAARPRSATPGESRDLKTRFPDHPRVEQLVHCLRFKMTTLTTVLSRYVLDVAIHKNWSKMRRRLGKLQEKRKSGGTAGDTADTRPVTPVDDYTPSEVEYDQQSEASHVDSISAWAEEDHTETTTTNLVQIHSINSLVTYHHLVVDRILRAMLLSQTSKAQQSTLAMLMQLFTIILDFGKTLKEVEMDLVDEDEGVQKVMDICKAWREQETIFVHALERLSLRTAQTPQSHEETAPSAEDRDLALLMQDDNVDGDADSNGPSRHTFSMGNEDLADLLIRLRLGDPELGRRGKWTARHTTV